MLLIAMGLTDPVAAPLGNFFAGFFVDRLGRIKMILIGLVTCIVALVIQSVVVLRGNGNVVASSFGVFSFFLFFIGFCTFYDVPCWACEPIRSFTVVYC